MTRRPTEPTPAAGTGVHVQSDDDARRQDAERLVTDSGLSLAPVAGDAMFRLIAEGPCWTVIRRDGARLRLDFTRGEAARNARQTSPRTRPLLRAVAATRFASRYGRAPHVLDATAGLGEDGWLCAAAGLEITWLERSPLLHRLLAQALAHAARDARTAPVAARVTLRRADALGWMSADRHDDRPDVICLDPMFPPRRRSARVGKGMQFLQDLLGPGEPPIALLEHALQCATAHVVVKRPRAAPPLAPPPGSVCTAIHSPSLRFDVYRRTHTTR